MAGESWLEMPLGEFVTLQRGHDLPEGRRVEGNVPILGSFGITGWHNIAKAKAPGITVGRSGASFGVVSYSAVDYWPLNTALYVIDFHGNDERFAYYFLKEFDFRRYNSGSAQPSLNRNFVHPVQVLVPPLPEQRAIAHVLGSLDDKIELNQRMNNTLEGTARTLFKSWFVDFDPVRAQAEARTLGIPEDITSLFPDSFEDSELGAIPAGWKIGRFDDLVEHLREQENPLSSLETLFHHYSIPAFDSAQWPKAEFGATIKSIKWRVPPNVILLSKLNPEIERVWLVDVQPEERAICSTELLVLKPRAPFGRAYAYCLARSFTFRQQIESLVTGTSKSHQRAQADSVLQLPVVIPPTSILKKFEAYASPLLARTLSCRRQSRTLGAIREGLRPRLISGETRIPFPERIVGERAV